MLVKKVLEVLSKLDMFFVLDVMDVMKLIYIILKKKVLRFVKCNNLDCSGV